MKKNQMWHSTLMQMSDTDKLAALFVVVLHLILIRFDLFLWMFYDLI